MELMIKIIGILIILSVFSVFFLATYKTIGLKAAICVWVLAIIMTILTVTGVWFLFWVKN